MKKSKVTRLMEMAGIRHRSDILKEGLFDDEPDEEADDEGGDDEAEDTDADADAEEEEEEEEVEEVEEPPEKLSAKEIADLGPGEIDQELDDVMGNLFDDSIKSTQAKMQSESIHKFGLKNLLFENEDLEAFDMTKFASDTARLITHYDTQLDIEGMLFNKAKEYLLNSFGDDGTNAVDDFEEHMHRVHGIDFAGQFKEDSPVALAAGAGGESSA
jgi:hypothetical protein